LVSRNYAAINREVKEVLSEKSQIRQKGCFRAYLDPNVTDFGLLHFSKLFVYYALRRVVPIDFPVTPGGGGWGSPLRCQIIQGR